jgi:predicted metalloprotease with PDZ domain
LRALDAEIRQRSNEEHNLDDAVRALMALKRRVSSADLRDAVRALIGRDSEVLQTPLLDA